MMANLTPTRSPEFDALRNRFHSLKRRLRRAQSDAEKDKILRSMSKVWVEAQSLIHSPKSYPQKLTVSSVATQFFLE